MKYGVGKSDQLIITSVFILHSPGRRLSSPCSQADTFEWSTWENRKRMVREISFMRTYLHEYEAGTF